MNIDEVFQTAVKSHQAGDYQHARNLYEEIINIQPDHSCALHYLGVLCLQQGNFDCAIQYIEKALQVNPNDSNAYYNLGIAFQNRRFFNEAVRAYQKAIELNPDNTDAYVNIGVIYKEKGRLDDAILSYRKALYLNPEHLAALYNLGYALQMRKQFDEAIAYFQKTLRMNPHLLASYQNLGLIYQEKGLLEQAMECFQKVLQIDSSFPDAHVALASVFHANGQLDEALVHFTKAIELKADSANAYYGLGIVLKEMGRTDEALTAFEKALEYSPDFLQARWAHCIACLQPVYQNEASIHDTRTRYTQELLKLYSMISSLSDQDIEALSDAIGSIQPFYLTVQGLNDRDLQKIYGELVCKIMALRYPEFAELPRRFLKTEREALRIGFVSMFFNWHSVWKIPLRGWIENLDRKKFIVHGYHTGRKKDASTEVARQLCDRYVEDISSFKDMCRIIRDDNLHALIYPEIGMDPVSLKLASLRLAPVQCTSLGHPDTTGLPTIDYYLSSDLMEPPDADQHYTEKLVRLANLGFFYSTFEVPQVKLSRPVLGLKEHSVVYLCSHSLFTHLPQYDFIYPRIALEMNTSQFVFIAHKNKTVTSQFYSRIKDAFSRMGLNVDEYVMILHRLDQERYHALNRLSDVFLDTIGWSANNSTFEALDCNLPVMTLPGALMRQRHCAGILSMMGLTETIASSVDEYIEIAVRLGRDSEWRSHIAEKIQMSKHKIYRDEDSIRALEEFLFKAVEVQSNA